MGFNIRMGLPEMEALWKDLSTRQQEGKLDRDEEKSFKKLVKALCHLGQNPRHNSLASHEIDDLTRKYGFKVFQSYLENNTPSAGRMFWAYGPDRGDITGTGHRAAPRRPKTRGLPTDQVVLSAIGKDTGKAHRE